MHIWVSHKFVNSIMPICVFGIIDSLRNLVSQTNTACNPHFPSSLHHFKPQCENPLTSPHYPTNIHSGMQYYSTNNKTTSLSAPILWVLVFQQVLGEVIFICDCFHLRLFVIILLRSSLIFSNSFNILKRNLR